MNNKSVLAVVTAQTAVIIGLLYLIWNQNSNELILNKNIYIDDIDIINVEDNLSGFAGGFTSQQTIVK